MKINAVKRDLAEAETMLLASLETHLDRKRDPADCNLHLALVHIVACAR